MWRRMTHGHPDHGHPDHGHLENRFSPSGDPVPNRHRFDNPKSSFPNRNLQR
jgi:hypothetical protein